MRKEIINGQEYQIDEILDGFTIHQKPVDLFRYLIRTYSNEGDLVFDGYLGSGTTQVAAYVENRNFKGSELKKEYFELSQVRFKAQIAQQQLFM